MRTVLIFLWKKWIKSYPYVTCLKYVYSKGKLDCISSIFIMTTQMNFDNNKGLNYGLLYVRLQKRRHAPHIQNLQRNFVCHGHWEEITCKIRGVYGYRIGRQIVKSVCLHLCLRDMDMWSITEFHGQGLCIDLCY